MMLEYATHYRGSENREQVAEVGAGCVGRKLLVWGMDLFLYHKFFFSPLSNEEMADWFRRGCLFPRVDACGVR